MSDRGDGDGDGGGNNKDKKSSGLDCLDPSICDCADGPGCLAGLLFIALAGTAYGIFYVVMRTLGRDPQTWSGSGAAITLILAASLGAAGYAWFWMEKHWK